jgi:hypothetical protein
MTFESSFSTVGAPDLLANSGVIYYELEMLKDGGFSQFGFAQKDSVEPCSDKPSTDRAGDNGTSWGLDGHSQCKWHGGDNFEWPCSWTPGNTIGFAANIDKGMIAVSKDAATGPALRMVLVLCFMIHPSRKESTRTPQHGIIKCDTASTKIMASSTGHPLIPFGMSIFPSARLPSSIVERRD